MVSNLHLVAKLQSNSPTHHQDAARMAVRSRSLVAEAEAAESSIPRISVGLFLLLAFRLAGVQAVLSYLQVFLLFLTAHKLVEIEAEQPGLPVLLLRLLGCSKVQVVSFLRLTFLLLPLPLSQLRCHRITSHHHRHLQLKSVPSASRAVLEPSGVLQHLRICVSHRPRLHPQVYVRKVHHRRVRLRESPGRTFSSCPQH